MYRDRIVGQNPLWYHRLDDAPGAQTVTAEVGGISGNPVGSPTFEQKSLVSDGTGALFGVNDGISFNSHPLATLTEFSLEVWVRVDTLKTCHFIRDFQSTSNFITLGLAYGEGYGFWFGLKSGFSYYALGPQNGVEAGRWYHLVATFSGGNYMRLYKDGVLEGELNSGVPNAVPTFSGTFNYSSTGGEGHVGALDEVILHSRTLTPAEIAENYETGRTSTLVGTTETPIQNVAGLLYDWNIHPSLGGTLTTPFQTAFVTNKLTNDSPEALSDMPLFGRPSDLEFFHLINKELLGNIMSLSCILYKILPGTVQTNIYGESVSGGSAKTYLPGVKVDASIQHDPVQVVGQDGVLSKQQRATFKFHRATLEDKEVYPEEGDVIEWNGGYYEIDNVIENQLVAGQVSQYHNWSFVCEAHRTRRSKLNIEKRYE